MAFSRFCAAASLLGAILLGCGDDSLERGLAPPDEQAAPASERELEMTEEERRKQQLGEVEEQLDEARQDLEEQTAP